MDAAGGRFDVPTGSTKNRQPPGIHQTRGGEPSKRIWKVISCLGPPGRFTSQTENRKREVRPGGPARQGRLRFVWERPTGAHTDKEMAFSFLEFLFLSSHPVVPDGFISTYFYWKRWSGGQHDRNEKDVIPEENGRDNDMDGSGNSFKAARHPIFTKEFPPSIHSRVYGISCCIIINSSY